MPKTKSHSGTKDRLRVTKKGKVMARKSSRNHFMQKKSSSRKRTYSSFQEISGSAKLTIKSKLGK